MDRSEHRKKIAFIGMPGSGKSSTINILLRREECQTGQTFMKGGLTKQFQQYDSYQTSKPLSVSNTNAIVDASVRNDWQEEYHFGRRYLLVDSSNDFNEFQIRKNEFDFFAFVCPFTRYTLERKQYLERIVQAIGDSFFDRCILIFTQCSKEQEEGNIKQEIESVAKIDENIKKIKNKRLICPSRFQNERLDDFRNVFHEVLSEIDYELNGRYKCPNCALS